MIQKIRVAKSCITVMNLVSIEFFVASICICCREITYLFSFI